MIRLESHLIGNHNQNCQNDYDYLTILPFSEIIITWQQRISLILDKMEAKLKEDFYVILVFVPLKGD